MLAAMSKILLIHGPNLNLLGSRQTEVYGYVSSETIVADLQKQFPSHQIQYFQSNSEAELVDAIQNARQQFDGIVINAGAFSHTSIAIADALRSVNMPSIAVHISNIYNRESFRHTDLVGDACKGAIVGLGVAGYAIALEHLTENF